MANRQQYHPGYAQYNQWMPVNHGPHDSRLPRKQTTVSHSFEIADDSVPECRKQSFKQKYLGGLKRTLRAFVVTTCIILAINVGWLLYAKAKYGIVDGYGTIKEGNCTDIKKTNVYLHLAINILSTLLLTGSNAFMAAYSGPTRQEVDRAHQRRRWLHVGCVSLRNMRGISWRKSLVVMILATSSVPFHLLFNSLVFTSLATNNYYWAVVAEDFLTGSSFNLTGPPEYAEYDTDHIHGPVFSLNSTLPDDSLGDMLSVDDSSDLATLASFYQYFDDMRTNSSKWDRLDPAACIKAYSNVFITTRRNLFLVSSAKNDTNSVLLYGSSDMDTALDTNFWICSEGFQDGGQMTCNPRKYLADAASWEVFGYPIEYCLSENVSSTNTCEIKFSWKIMIVVVSFNALKAVAMLWILLRLDAQHILSCVGDAAASFIKHPDPTTAQICLADRRDIDRFWRRPGPRIWNISISRHWGRALSKKRWILFFLIMCCSWAFVAFFGVWGFIHSSDTGASLTISGLYSLGFGTINQNAMVFYGGGGNALSNSLIANIPQVALAIIYLMYMSIMTSMFTAMDWARFADSPQTLMVGTPYGKQRGTWLLGAPPVYGIGLLALQTLLHWFVSQSLFVVQLKVYDKLGHLAQSDDAYGGTIENCGYSPIAIICSLVASGVLFLSAIVFMWRKLPRGSPPVVSTCSAAISAACHVPAAMVGEEIVYQKLRWGVSANGHCSLAPASAWEVGFSGPPIAGMVYAGLKERSECKATEEDEAVHG